MKAALLIDFDNLADRLRESDYSGYSVKEVVASLSSYLRSKGGISLEEQIIFCPDNNISPKLKNDLKIECDIDFEPSVGKKNAADIRLVARAMRLALDADFEQFFVVSGDMDFVDLAFELEDLRLTCELWPFDRSQKLNPTMLRWGQAQPGRLRYVAEELSMPEKRADIRSDDDHLLILCAQRWVVSGEFLIRELDFARHYESVGVWSSMHEIRDICHQRSELFLQWRHPAGGTRRILNYRDPQVRDVLRAADIAIRCVIENRGVCTMGDIASAYVTEPIFSLGAKTEDLVAELIRTGILSKTSFGIELAADTPRLGVIGLLRRYGLAVQIRVEQDREKGKDERFGWRSIDWLLLHHLYPGIRDLKSLNETTRKLLQQTSDAANRAAKAASLVDQVMVVEPDGTQRQKFVLNESHELLVQARKEMSLVVNAVMPLFVGPEAAQRDVEAAIEAALPDLAPLERRTLYDVARSLRILGSKSGVVYLGANAERASRW